MNVRLWINRRWWRWHRCRVDFSVDFDNIRSVTGSIVLHKRRQGVYADTRANWCLLWTQHRGRYDVIHDVTSQVRALFSGLRTLRTSWIFDEATPVAVSSRSSEGHVFVCCRRLQQLEYREKFVDFAVASRVTLVKFRTVCIFLFTCFAYYK